MKEVIQVVREMVAGSGKWRTYEDVHYYNSPAAVETHSSSSNEDIKFSYCRRGVVRGVWCGEGVW